MAEEKDTFEKKLEKLEKITKDLQNPKTELEKAVTLFEEGMKISKEIDKELSKLERRIDIVTSSTDEEGIVTEEYK